MDMAKPKIRFKGYTDDWEQRKLGDMMDVTSVKRIRQSDWTDSGVRFLRARDIVAESKNEEVSEPLFISQEKYDEYSAVSGKVEKGDLLVTGVGTIGVPMLINSEEPLYFKDGNIIWFKNKNAIDGRFFYHSFNGLNIQKFIKESAGTGTVGTYTIENGKKTPINLPLRKEEQEKIGEYFSNLDHLITLHQRKCEETKKLKKYMLQKMFPQNGQKVPEIRFSGFTDAWEQRKLEDIMDTVTDYVAAGSFEDIRNNVTYLNEPGYAQLVRTVDLKKKFTNNDSIYVDESAFKYLWRVNLNEECIVLPNIGANIGEVYFVEPSGLPYDNNVLGPNAILLKANEDTYFAFTALNNLTFQKQLFENVGSSGQPKFNKTELKSIQLYMPQNEEQEKIGQYFRDLDHLITLHQHKCEQLQSMKKFMLQNMFV